MAFDLCDFLLIKVYSFMDESDKSAWSFYEAMNVVRDVRLHDGIELNPHEVYEIIREMIEQDEEE